MSHSKISILPGLFLIGLGAILLIHRLNIFHFDWYQTYPLIFTLIGLTLLISGILNANGSALFWGTNFTLAGIFFLLRNYDVINYYYMHDVWPIFFMIFGKY